MRTLIDSGWAVLILLIALAATAVADTTIVNRALLGSQQLEISGFGDFRVNLNEPSSTQRFAIGQAEMALAYQLNSRARSQMTLAYADNAFGIGSFTLEYRAIIADPGSARALIKGLTIQAGQFDIPIGIDWQRYASPDRNLISTPRMVSNLHGAWNDLGFAVDAASDYVNAAIFAANGYCFDGTTPGGVELYTANRFATGGRVGLLPLSALELGASAAKIFGKSGSADISLVGIDLRCDIKHTSFHAEIMREQLDDTAGSPFDNTGYYVELTQEFGSWVFALQREEVWSDQADEDDYSGVLAGISKQIGERISARWETRYDISLRELYGTGQLVMQF